MLETKKTVVQKLIIAQTFFSRIKGLLGRKELLENEAMLITSCNSIHMFFMLFAIDVVYMDKNGRILKIIENLQPWRISACWGSKNVLEMPAGSARKAGLAVGLVISIIEQGD